MTILIPPTGLRHAGFASVLPEAQIINVSSDYSPIRKEMEIKSILTQQKPDAIFASDDLTAILVMKIADELGIAIPEDLKIIGYDGTYFIENYFPPSHHHQATLTRDCSPDGRPSSSKNSKEKM